MVLKGGGGGFKSVYVTGRIQIYFKILRNLMKGQQKKNAIERGFAHICMTSILEQKWFSLADCSNVFSWQRSQILINVNEVKLNSCEIIFAFSLVNSCYNTNNGVITTFIISIVLFITINVNKVTFIEQNQARLTGFYR